jgi:hypothetical protein
MSQMGQTEKYSERADIFRSSPIADAAVWLGLVQAEGSVFISNPIFRNSPFARALPAPEQTDKVFAISLPVGNWIVFYSFVYRPRDLVCVCTAAMRQKLPFPSFIEVCKNLVINKCPSEACRLDDGIRLVSQAISPIA